MRGIRVWRGRRPGRRLRVHAPEYLPACSCGPCRPPGLPPLPPAGRSLLAKEQARIRQQYEERLRDLEGERQSVQEDKAQVRGGGEQGELCGPGA